MSAPLVDRHAGHRPEIDGLRAVAVACPPMFGIDKRELAATRVQDIACAAANAQIEAALRAPPFADILLVGRRSYSATGTGIGADAHDRIEVSPDRPTAVAGTLDALTEMGSRVHVLRQVPVIPDDGSLPVARALARKEAVPQERMQVPLDAALAYEAAGLTPFVAGGSQISLIDPRPLHCNANACSVLQNSRTVYFGNNHVTNQRALQMRHLFDPMLSRRESLS